MCIPSSFDSLDKNIKIGFSETSALQVNGITGFVINADYFYVRVSVTIPFLAGFFRLDLIPPSGEEITLVWTNLAFDLLPTEYTIISDKARNDVLSNYQTMIQPNRVLQSKGFLTLKGINPNGVWVLKTTGIDGNTEGVVNNWGITLELEACPTNYCQNNGSCYIEPNQRIFCDCPSGYSGDYCDVTTEYSRRNSDLWK